MTDIFINPKYLQEICSIIKGLYPNATIWAYGSRVGGDAHNGSDLDLVVKDFGQDVGHINELKEAFTESNIPFLIDILEFERIPQSFQKEIEKKYVVIYNGKSQEKNL